MSDNVSKIQPSSSDTPASGHSHITSGLRLRLRYGAALILGLPAYISFIILYLANQITDAGIILGIFFAYISAYCVGLFLLRHLTNILGVMEKAVAPDPLERSPITFGAILSFGFPTLLDNITRLNRTWDKRLLKLQQELVQLKNTMTYLPQPVVILDQNNQILMLNELALSISSKKLSLEDFISQDITQLIRDPKSLEIIKGVKEGTLSDINHELTVAGAPSQTFAMQIRHIPIPPSLPSPLKASVPTILIMWQDLSLSRQVEQTRVDFVANVSHELRTPLASLSGFIETLQGPAQGDLPATQRFLAIMSDQAARMTRLVSDLLSLSRIELNETTPPTTLISVYDTLVKTLYVLRMAAEKQSVTLNLYGPATQKITYTDHHPTSKTDLLISTESDTLQYNMSSVLDPDIDLFWKVLGDADELSQVFQNLIENAIKYGQSGKSVDIFVDCQKETAISARHGSPFLVITIRDYGEGIAEHHLPRLTERFYRADPARSRELGGTGLGLAIVKHILNRHKATLSIDSKKGEGSVFSVHLPLYHTQET